ncbi:glycosyltransferase family 4 protein [Xenorhabdus bovienii]|uniref:glycosyltransferase family 4 protein n=1 Tax=Xenorhabdus bovienii TaxID=40576 RepID=UPI0023B24DD9|nr:glycosyltransferase family 1 protein [Xenorhabdus bovienii]MDE9544016.1 glycosyltransferase family 4 protein [Xenorhabdus bovienii]
MIVIDGIIFSLQKSGGISVYFNEILKRLKSNGIQHSLYLYNNDNNKTLSRDSIITPILKKNNLISLKRYMNFPLEKENAVFHSSYYRIPDVRQKNTKIITTVHDFTYEKYFPFIKKNIHHWQKKRAILNSDEIICISENTKSDLIKYIPESKEKKIHVIYNGVSDKFHVISNINHLENNFIIFIGSRVSYKNFTNVVLSIKSLKDIHLKIIGGGPLNKQEKELLNSNIKNRYIKIDYATDNQLNTLYNQAHALVYPSLYEGFGIPVIEAMKAGCPVIATNKSSIPEISSDAAILLDNPNSDCIKQAIIDLEKNSFRKNIIKKGINQGNKFSWDIMFSKLMHVYKS